MSEPWRQAGISLLRYSNIAGQCVRRALKDTAGSGEGAVSQKARAEMRDVFEVSFRRFEGGILKPKGKQRLLVLV